MPLFARIVRSPVLTRIALDAVNRVDLQWSLLDDALREVAPRARGRLLDVGCGEKPYEAIFRSHVTEYIGVEHEGVFAQTHAARRDAKRPDHYYDGEHLPFDDASFDTVMSVQVLEHTPRPQQLLNEMARVARPGAILILCAPFSFRLHEEPHDYFRYTPHGLRVLCDDAGFVVQSVRPVGGLWSVLGHKLNSFLAFRVIRAGAVGQALGKLGHEREATESVRRWTVPGAGLAMVVISASARVLDRVVPEPTEALGYLVVAERKC